DLDEEVAYGAVGSPDALAADPALNAVRGAGRNSDADRLTLVCGHLDVGAQRRLGERDRHDDRQVVPGAPEDRMAADVHAHVQVAGRAAALAGSALALELDPLPVGHAGRDPGLDGPRAHRPPAARARGARILDDHSPAPAGGARLGERERALVPARLAGALAVRTHLRHGAGLSAGAAADLARTLVSQPQRHRRAVDRVAERQRGLGLDIGAAARPGLRSRGAAAAVAEHAEQVA